MKKLLLLITLLLIITTGSAFAQNGTLKAKFIRSTDGLPYKEQVQIYTATGVYVAQRHVDTTGILQYNLAPGSYKIILYTGNYEPWTSEILEISSGDTNKYYFDNPVYVTRLGVVKAQFINSITGLPYNEAVRIYTSNGTYIAQPSCNAQGILQYNLKAGSYKIKSYSSNIEPWTSEILTITSGDTNIYYLNNPVYLTPFGKLRAQFINSVTGLPYTESVRIYTSSGTYIAQPTCNAQGILQYNLKAGSYNIRLYSGNFDPWSSTNLTIVSGETNNYYIDNPVYVTPRGIFLAKFLRSTDSWPYTDWIRLYKEDGTYISQVKPNTEGVYLQKLTAGGYKVKLYTYSYHGWTSPVFYLTAGDTNKYFFDNPVLIDPITGILKTKFVRSIDSLPAGPIRVMLKHTSPFVDSQVVTLDSNGVFNQPVQIGNYYFTNLPSRSDYQPFQTTAVTITANATNEVLFNTPVQLDLTKGIIKAKFLCNTTGQPVGAIQLMLRQISPVIDSQIVTLDTNGTISINVFPGEYQFTNHPTNDYGYKPFSTGSLAIMANVIDYTLLSDPYLITKKSYSLHFNGLYDYIVCDNDPSLNFDKTMTVELWMKTSPSNIGGQTVIERWSTTGGNPGYYIILFPNSGNYQFSIQSKRFSNSYLPAPSDHKWHHIAFVWAESYFKLYVDGNVTYSQPISSVTTFGISPRPLTIGGVQDRNSGFFGDMDEIRIWGTARTQQEIQSNMHNLLTGQESGLAAYYQTDEGSGNVINDIAGHNSQGAFVGNVLWQEGDFPHTAGTLTKARDKADEESDVKAEIPQSFALDQNYPNPFNPTTTIKYALKEDAKVNLKIYNALGQEVRTLVNEHQNAGFREIMWDGKNNKGSAVPSGVYIYRLVAGSSFVKSNKMMLMK